MGVFGSSTSLCLGNHHCMQLALLTSNAAETASTVLGVICVFVWFIAEIPQLVTNFRHKSTEGLSITFLITWIIGDLFNLIGCWLEPATLPTQLYTAVLYTLITLILFYQTIYYVHIYPRRKYKKQFKVETLTYAEQSSDEMENGNDAADQSNRFNDFHKDIGLSSPIPLPELSQKNSSGRDYYYQSARYLSMSPSSTSVSFSAQRVAPTPRNLNPIEEPLLGSAVASQSAPVSNIKTTLCLASTLTFLGAFNLLQSPDTIFHSMVSKPGKESVIYVGRKLLQVSGDQAPHATEGERVIGTYLGWAMAFIYMGGRLPQISLNIKRGNTEGVNPLMFVFALIGNCTYLASILVASLDWSRIRPNLPWLVEAGGCTLLDIFILTQVIYFRYLASRRQRIYKPQTVA